jgi:hypothetical protein
MNKLIPISLIAAIALLASGGAGAQEKFRVQLPIKIDAAGGTSDRIKTECKIDTTLANYMVVKVTNQFPGSGALEGNEAAPADAKVLRLTIINVFGLGGGAYSGTKQMSVRAEIVVNKKVLATTILERQSMGGAAGLFGGGTCSAFNKISSVLANDIAAWMISAR